MRKNPLSDIIQERTERAQKTYSFKEEHDPCLPADHWFQNSDKGLTFFIVFYTQACRWTQCLGCNLPSQMSQHHVSFRNIMKQIDHIFNVILSPEQKTGLKKIIISNNGSVLDEETFSTTSLLYFVAMMNIHCPNISVLSIESRAEYVDMIELEMISRALKEGDTPTELEVAIGLEAFDEQIRNVHFRKGLSLKTLEETAEKLARHGFHMKAYFMLKPVPGINEDQAVDDVIKGIDYLDSVSKKYNIKINMHLNPTYVARGTALEESFMSGLYQPPLLENVKRCVLSAEGRSISVYVGLNDEGLAVQEGSFIRKGDEDLLRKLDQFNATQDFTALK